MGNKEILKRDFKELDENTLYYINNGEIIPLEKDHNKVMAMICEAENE